MLLGYLKVALLGGLMRNLEGKEGLEPGFVGLEGVAGAPLWYRYISFQDKYILLTKVQKVFLSLHRNKHF